MDSQIGNWVTFNTRDDLSQEEKRLKVEDDGSVSSTEDTLLNKSERFSHFIIENIRFTPKVIEFSNAFEGKQFSEKITIQNVGKDPVLVKIGEPNSFIFQLKKPSLHAKFLPSGASISKVVTYTYHNDDLLQRSQIPVQVNGFQVDYPIIVKKAEPEIEVHPQKLNFEIINLGATAKSMTLTIRNTGGKRTKFEVDCGKHLDLVVNPTRGTVKPKHSVDVCVEIMGFYEGEFYRELWIKTTEVPIRVPVLVEVVRPRLEIMYPKGTENFTLINFPPTFIGAQSASSFILKNVSNEMSLFVVLAEMDGKLMELNEATKLSDSLSMFLLPNREGLLAPFETRIFNILFCPKSRVEKKGWHNQNGKNDSQNEKKECDHVVFFWIQSVFCIQQKEFVDISARNSIMQKKSSVTQKPLGSDLVERQTFRHSQDQRTEANFTGAIMSNFPGAREEKALRFCLYGQAIQPDILIQPSVLTFGDLNLGEAKNKVLIITNNNTIGVRCKICKTMNITAKPKSIWLKGEKSHEFLISLTPRSAGIFKTKIEIQLLAESDFLTGKKGMKEIKRLVVGITYTAHDVSLSKTPKAGLGITPLRKDEAGINKEHITFKNADRLPYAAVLGLKKGFKPDWMKKEKDKGKVENALVALPNDRPRLFYTWPKDKLCRSIFKGFLRYSPPEDLAYTLSEEGKLEKKKRRAIWDEYISKRLLQHPDQEEVQCLVKYSFKANYEKYCKPPKPNIETAIGVKNYLEQKKDMSNFPLVPLSPLFLFHINVNPKLINFKMVPIATKTHETIVVNNMNSFPITVRFIPGNSNVSLMENGTVLIPSCGTKGINVFFESKEFGRYFGFLNYVINGAHEFKITISAFVTTKTLYVSDKNLNLEFRKCGPKDAFQHSSIFLPLENILPCPIKYKLTIMEESAFATPIAEGLAPPRSIILTEVCLQMTPGKSFYSEITLTSESGSTELIKLSCPYKKIAVDFLNNEMDMQDVPLNLPTKLTPVILNGCYHDVPFEVLSVRPMPGVTVIPKEGVIKARSFFYLTIIVKIPVIMKFSFNINLSVHFSSRISMTVKGKVVLPLIRMRPSEVIMRKICEQSFDTVAICATNEGTTRAEIKVDFTSCPEFSVVDGETDFNLLPTQSTKIVIRFDPKNISRYVFYLPIIINHILGPPMIQEEETEIAGYYTSYYENDFADYGEVYTSKMMLPCVCINCTVVPPLLHISPLSIDFGEKRIPLQFQTQNITIRNVSGGDVSFCISTLDLGDAGENHFELTVVDGSPAELKFKSIKVRLQRHEKLVLVATFVPKKYGNHTVNIPIYVKGYHTGLAYNVITLSGTWMTSRIFPGSNEVYFLPLPLGVASDVILTVCAENYNTTDTLKCTVRDSLDSDNEAVQEQITTRWLKEPHVTESCGIQVFQLQITFQSFVPVSLRCYLVFYDSTGGYATTLVTASADNSAISSHLFLKTKSCAYKLVREPSSSPKLKTEEPPVIPYKSDTKSELKLPTEGKSSSKSISAFSVSLSLEQSTANIEPLENGPMLVMQMTRSMNRISQLQFVKLLGNLEKCKLDNPPVKLTKKKRTSLFSLASSTNASKGAMSSNVTPEGLDTFPFPNFPNQGNVYWEYFQNVLTSVERWMFEVVMRCDQYLLIPQSFQRVMVLDVPTYTDKPEKPKEKDFLYFLEQVVGTGAKLNLPERPLSPKKNPDAEKAHATRTFFHQILTFLQGRGCHLAHIRAEHLMEYELYDIYTKTSENVEVFYWEGAEPKKTQKLGDDISVQTQSKNKSDKENIFKETSSALFPKDFWTKSFSESFHQVGSELYKTDESNPDSFLEPSQGSNYNIVNKKQYYHNTDILNKELFELRSKQSWLDIVIQIFRVFVLAKIVKKKTIPQTKFYEMSDRKIVEMGYVSYVRNYLKKSRLHFQGSQTEQQDSIGSNVYTQQERILLGWLNYHLQGQKDILWKETDRCVLTGRVLNNFDKDLSDSVALISLTAAHCPYIVSEFFPDVFVKPETPDKLLHNAGRLVQAWRTLQLGMSVETQDIINANSVFMIMLLIQMYEILPCLHPHSTIMFSAPLNSEITRTIQVKNESNQRLVYEPKFFGEDQIFFSLKDSSLIEVKPLKAATITIIFSVKKIRKISATLYLNGFTSSPDFAKPMAFYLEGEPSDITEYDKLSFSSPLYKVICTDITIKPPYPEPTTYEVWYTTKKPAYLEGCLDISFKPWSLIRKTNVARRLFLNKSEVTINAEEGTATLNVTVACLTQKKRYFWLMFRSETGDFIMLIEIGTKPTENLTILNGSYSESWSSSATCTCLATSPRKMDTSCPLLLVLGIPARNNALWNALYKMFLKTLHKEEIGFWNKHFESNIGLCLILWLLSPAEEEEVVDEFVGVLPTKVTYTLNADPPGKNYIVLPTHIDIPDVREKTEIQIPIHISKNAPATFDFKLTMTSENKKEIRSLKVFVHPPDAQHPGKCKAMTLP